ncbi:MAG: hypothetical protein KJ709_08520 [Nanoarchaeota archaeon]|nr:hypothetical protein [Nanoarchaeota archaeon]
MAIGGIGGLYGATSSVGGRALSRRDFLIRGVISAGIFGIVGSAGSALGVRLGRYPRIQSEIHCASENAKYFQQQVKELFHT